MNDLEICMLAIELKDLTFSYKKAAKPVIDGLNLAVTKHEVVAIMGVSGSGKSTLLQLISLLRKPDSGSITIGDKSCENMSDKESSRYRGENIGYVLQDYALFEDKTVFENLMFAMNINNGKKNNPRGVCKTLMEEFEMLQYADQLTGKLSGGQKQRVAIMRALVNNPDIILADEPTGSLDRENSKIITQMLYNLSREYEKTVIIVTHDKDVAAMADTIYNIIDGKLYEV